MTTALRPSLGERCALTTSMKVKYAVCHINLIYRISSKSRRTSNCRRLRNLACSSIMLNALNAALEFSLHMVKGRHYSAHIYVRYIDIDSK